LGIALSQLYDVQIAINLLAIPNHCVERVDPSTYLVRTRCPGYKPEAASLAFQLIDDGDSGVLRITNAENS
jgi:hypothetical protein